MSTLWCREYRDKRDGGQRKNGSRFARRVFCAEMSAQTDGFLAVLSSTDLPAWGAGYAVDGESDAAMVVVDRTPRQIGPRHWEIDVQYDSDQEAKENQPPEGGTQSAWWINVGWGNDQIQVPVIGSGEWSEGAGEFVLNEAFASSAGEPFDPPAMADDARPILTFTGGVLTWRTDYAQQYMNAVNSDMFFGGAPRTWRIIQFDTPGREQVEFGDLTVIYYPITIAMLYRKDTHDIVALDQGTYYLEDGDKKAFLTEEGQPFIGLLDGDSGKLGEGCKPQHVSCRHYKELPFAVLGLPNQMPR